MDIGWKIWEESAPWERDYFLPVPTKGLNHWKRYECKYAEATVLSQVLEANLTLNGEKLLCEGVAGRLWREHSPRAFLTSCTGCLEYPSNWQDAIGGWSPGQSQAMQRRVPRILRAGRGNSLGERELEEDLENHLLKIGYDVGLVREQVDRLRKARDFVARCSAEGIQEEEMERELEKGWISEEEESLDVSEEEMVEWRELEGNIVQVESFGTVTPRAEEHKTTETEVVESGVFPSDLLDFSHLAKKAKVQNEPASQKILVTGKLQSARLVPESAGNQKLQSAQLGTRAPCTEEATQAMPVKELTIQRERQHRPAGIVETKPRRKRQVKIEQEIPVVPPGYLVAFAHKLRCIHYVGRCWRKPGRDIKNWQYYGQEQPEEQDYDHYCKHCWSKGTLPGQDSEQQCAADDSGSFSTDA